MLIQYFKRFREFFKDEAGASAVEYGLIIGLIAVALIVVLGLVAGDGTTTGLTGLFQEVATEVNNAGN